MFAESSTTTTSKTGSLRMHIPGSRYPGTAAARRSELPLALPSPGPRHFRPFHPGPAVVNRRTAATETTTSATTNPALYSVANLKAADSDSVQRVREWRLSYRAAASGTTSTTSLYSGCRKRVETIGDEVTAAPDDHRESHGSCTANSPISTQDLRVGVLRPRAIAGEWGDTSNLDQQLVVIDEIIPGYGKGEFNLKSRWTGGGVHSR
eukprot:3397249-Rhodomonas_salina.1